jgi:hypothetical protein
VLRSRLIQQVSRMASLTFRCALTAAEVPVPFSPDPESDPNTYEYVVCPACSRSHLVNRSTGKLIGDRDDT